MKTIVASILLGLTAVAAVASSASRVPADVQRAEKTSRAWLQGFVGKSQKEIVAKLGEPTLRSSWEQNATRQIFFRYDLQPKLRLELFFVGETVSAISYQIYL